MLAIRGQYRACPWQGGIFCRWNSPNYTCFLGAFTFLPLDSLKTRPIKEHLRTLHVKSKLAIDCIEYEDEYHRAMQYALGNTLIIDNMRLAKQICYGELGRGERHKAVTLKGKNYDHFFFCLVFSFFFF